VQDIQNKLISQNLLSDELMFTSDQHKREFLKPKIERLCTLMDAEYRINVDKLRK